MNPVVNVIVALVVIHSLVGAVRRGRGEAWAAARAVRPRDVLGTLLVMPVVVVAGAMLSSLPVLGWGWWSAMGGKGSVVFAGTGNGGVAAALVLLLIAVAVPELALREEEVFRKGSEHRNWAANARWAFFFGSIHAFMGIPIGYAIALTVAGSYFTFRYLHAYRRSERPVAARQALMTSTTAHIAWNWTLLLAVAVTTLAQHGN